MIAKDKCVIVGVGETPYTRGTDKTSVRLHLEAPFNAIEDAGLSPQDIDAYLEVTAGQAGVLHEHIISNLGIRDLRYYAAHRQGGAGAVAGVTSAVLAISAGVANYALITAGRSGFSDRVQRVSLSAEGPYTSGHRKFARDFESPFGVFAPVQLFAFYLRRHMYEYHTTSRQFGAIAVACRKHAMLNPKAVMRKPMTIEDHQNSRMVVDPLRLFDCCLETDGAGAFIITSAERARNLRHRPVYIMGIAQGSPDYPFSEINKIVPEIPGVRKAAKRAFTMAAVTPKDVDVDEIYDAFTGVCLIGIEDVGFCKKGEGGPFVEGGRIELGGELPINTHGGLLSEAHVSGVNHIIEAVRQLRGDCGERQVKNAEIALVEGEGNFGEGGVMLLRR